MKFASDLVRQHRLHIALILSLSMGLFLVGCGSPSSTSNLAITAWGPNSTQASVAFNVQPDGVAALWVNVDQQLDSKAYISLNDFKLKSAVSGKLITASVPAALYAQPGTYPLIVVDVIDGKEVKSNNVDFVVKPK